MAAKLPEILAPVATWEMCQAAVHNGADAVYIGMPGFNARGRTVDLTLVELAEMVRFCRQYSVKVFIACNILIFEDELLKLEALLRSVIELGVDAFIVQDIGVVRLIKEIAPWQAVHASTQMTVTNSEAIELLENLKIERFVLGRENSILELEKIRKATTKELEVFVHGALCVSYSGQCLTSESNSSRSANRGQCNQSCRFKYDLIVDGEKREMGEKRHLVSPQDLYGLEDLDQLIKIGIDSFKIEGRLKTSEYVASTVRNYREVSNSFIAGEKQLNFDQRRHELGIAFARGQFNGWYDGVNHQSLVDARFARPRGHELGAVLRIADGAIEIESSKDLQLGDGVVFHDFNADLEVGGMLYAVQALAKGKVRIKMARDFPIHKITLGMRVFLNARASFDKDQRSSFQDKSKLRRVALSAHLTGTLGSLLELELRDALGNSVQVKSEGVLEAAKSKGLTYKDAFAELSALSGTIFTLIELEFSVSENIFVNNRQLKKLRQEATAKLLELRASSNLKVIKQAQDIATWQRAAYESLEKPAITNQPKLAVLIREESQLQALQGLAVDCVYLDYEFNKQYERSLEQARAMGFRCGIATTRILKPQELGHLKYIARLKPDCILVRNLGALKFLKDFDIELIGDFSLNVSNALSATWLLEQGLKRITPAYDLNQRQLQSLLEVLPAQFCEVTVHQHMPSFHMEHCVFAAFLSKGKSFKDCGRPCEKHKLALRDELGISHPVKADAECRNTMFQGKAQSALRLIPELLQCEVGALRIEALFESASELRSKVEIYINAMQVEIDSDQNLEGLGAFERFGVSEGQLFNTREYKSFKKDLLRVVG